MGSVYPNLLKSATKFRVLLLRLKKSKLERIEAGNAATTVEIAKKKDGIEEESGNGSKNKFFTVKFKVEEVPIVSLFTRDGSKSQKQSIADESVSEEKKFSKDVMQKYLKKVKPLYVRVSKRYGEKLRFSGQLNSGSAPPSTVEKGEMEAGLVILYASIVKKKWAVNSAFMAFYAFAAVLICWVLLCYRMAFGDELLPFWGKGGPAIDQKYLIGQAIVPSSNHTKRGQIEITMPFYPMASLVYFQFTFAAITMILLAGSVLGRMNIKAWMAFVPLWLIFSYTVGAFSLWGGGFLYQWGVIDYSGGYVIHLSSGIAGLTAAYWVGPRLKIDRERFPPNNVLLMMAGAGLLWMGWSGFNGGAPYAANIDASIAVLNTNVCAATSLLVWTSLDVVFFGKPSVIGAVQGMMTGLVCITPGAGLVQTWAAIFMGILSGSIPWVSMMVLHKKSALLQKVKLTKARPMII